jgi:hypothetical protein
MKEFLRGKGKNIHILEDDSSYIITNDVYLDLLDPFTQFLIRSKTKKLSIDKLHHHH